MPNSVKILTAEQTGGKPIYKVGDGLYGMDGVRDHPTKPTKVDTFCVFSINDVHRVLRPLGFHVGNSTQEHASAIIMAMCAGAL